MFAAQGNWWKKRLVSRVKLAQLLELRNVFGSTNDNAKHAVELILLEQAESQVMFIFRKTLRFISMWQFDLEGGNAAKWGGVQRRIKAQLEANYCWRSNKHPRPSIYSVQKRKSQWKLYTCISVFPGRYSCFNVFIHSWKTQINKDCYHPPSSLGLRLKYHVFEQTLDFWSNIYQLLGEVNFMALFNVFEGLYVFVNKRSRVDDGRCEEWKVTDTNTHSSVAGKQN